MITMATLAISITMVVLTLAAQQLGPRLIRSFIADRRTQASLGLFVSTVIYLLLVLRSAYGQREAVANLAVTIGTVLVLLSVATLLFFVHHLARSIIADNVIDRIGTQLDKDIVRLLPDKSTAARESPEKTAEGAPISLVEGGYVQAIDYDSAARVATNAEATISYSIRAGDHAVPGVVAARITPQKAFNRDHCLAIRRTIYLGAERTAVQDLDFSIHQLVEIALRALSPGTNDPYTAIAVIDRLTQSIRIIMDRGTPREAWRDKEGRIRVIASMSNFDGVLDAAFSQIRQGTDMPAVLLRLAQNISQLFQQAHGNQRAALARHLKLVVAAGRRSIEEPEDLKGLETYAVLAASADVSADKDGRDRHKSRLTPVPTGVDGR